MSATAVQGFLGKIAEDESLQSELAKAMEADDDRAAVTELAKSKGYEFTSEELWAEIQARQAELEQRQAAGELSDEELEAVAGGGTPFFVVAAISVASVVTTGVSKW